MGLVSGTSLLLEIALTRLLSTLYFPPYVFGVISVAILGIGLGAALSTWRSDLRRIEYLPLYSIGAGVSAIVAVLYVLWVQIDPLHQLLFAFVTIPYIFIGLIFATAFSKHPGSSGRLYLADLLGAGTGTILVIPLMNAFGALDTLLLAAALFIVWSFVFAFQRAGVILAVGALALFASNVAQNWLDVDLKDALADKPITQALRSGGEIIETRWDAFARTDLVAPGDGGPYQLYVDGAAGSILPPQTDNDFLIGDIGFYPFAIGQPRNVFVIGPGGGLDVWFGLQANAQTIRAVEVNPASVDIVREYADYTGGLYDLAQVEVTVDEGRSALRRDTTDYDLIFLSQVITETSERGGLALSENRVYTVEAFGDYLDNLTRTGQIALRLYDELTLTRAFATALEAMRQDGMTDAEALSQMIVIIDPSVTPPIPLLIVSNTPFTQPDIVALGSVAREVGFEPLYLPGILALPPLDAIASGERGFDDVIADADANLSPTTDNRPYFFQFERGLPDNLILPAALAGLLVIAGAVGWILNARRSETRALRWTPLYFACLGVGFISIEIAAINLTSLTLGHPTIAVTTVIAVFLIGGGIGSGIADSSLEVNPLQIPPQVALSVAAVAPMWVIVWNLFSAELMGSGQLVRIGFAVLSLLPVTLLMGIPFPSGLRALAGADERQIALAWAVNGAATVVGSIMAVIVSILLGFYAVLVLGIAVYALAAGVAYVGTSEAA
jgi:hypothetical protein